MPERVGRLARALLVPVLFLLVGVSVVGAAPVGERVAATGEAPSVDHVVLTRE